jgi:hypothetical protein
MLMPSSAMCEHKLSPFHTHSMELPHLEFHSSRECFSLAFVSPLSRNYIDGSLELSQFLGGSRVQVVGRCCERVK